MHYILKQWRKVSATALSAARVSGLAVAAVLVISGVSFASSGVDLEVQDCPLREVVKVLVSQSGSNIIVVDDSKMEKKITATLKGVELDKALDYIVKFAGVSYSRMDDGTFIIGGAPAVVPTIAPSEVANLLPPVLEEIIEPEPVVMQPVAIEKIMLVHSSASELLALLAPGGHRAGTTPGLRPIDPWAGHRQPTDSTRALNVITEYGNNYDPTNLNTVEDNRVVVPTAAPSISPGAGRTADTSTGAAQGVPGYRPPGSTRPIPTQQPTTGGRTGTTTGTTSDEDFLWPEGVEDARPFDLDNSIIVKGTEDGIEKFKKIVRMLDVPPKQVSIKAEFVEVKTTDVKRFGIDWSLDRLDESFSTSFGPSGNVIFGFSRGNLTAQIRAQLTSDVGRVINAPIISTINNQPASLAINTVIPYWETVSTVVGTNVIQQAVPRFINVSTNLNVLPRVNGDGTITMQLSPQVADTGQIVAGPSGQSIPETRNQTLQTQRRVANGETIVVGGFIRKNDSNSYQRVPFLSDLPLVGTLFRTRARQTEDREVLIFITPTIIAQTGAGTVGDTLQL